MLRSKIPAVLLTFATLAAVPTTAFAESGEEQVQATESTTVMADRRPYRPPPRRYVRPAPRRVYVAPAYTPRPRRVIEVPYTPVFHFGIGLNGNSVMSAEGDSGESRPSFVEGLGDGAGFDISFGWRLSDFISLDFNWLMSFHDGGVESNDASLASFGLDLRFFLADRSRRVQPYIQAGVGGYVLGRDFEYETISGVGFQLGGGADFYLTQHVSIGGKILFRPAWLSNENERGPATMTGDLSLLTYGADLKFHF